MRPLVRVLPAKLYSLTGHHTISFRPYFSSVPLPYGLIDERTRQDTGGSKPSGKAVSFSGLNISLLEDKRLKEETARHLPAALDVAVIDRLKEFSNLRQ